MTNILDAIINIVKNPDFNLRSLGKAHNRANNMSEALEEYIKDVFAGTNNETDFDTRCKLISDTFSYLGNQNNPPDSILKGGDAIEVKKIESNDSSLALNSSYPKHKLYADSPMITTACKRCEEWQEKDILYTVGVVKADELKSLALVYGEDYCADSEIYERIKSTIKTGVESIENVEFSETKELGRVNRVDPLGITYLRVRGMWGIENPFTVFRYIYTRDMTKKFNLMAVINANKYNSFANKEKFEAFVNNVDSIKLNNVSIFDPNNPAITKKAKLITFAI